MLDSQNHRLYIPCIMSQNILIIHYLFIKAPEYNSLRHAGLDADPMTDISTSYLTLIHQSRGLLCPSGRPHLLYKANGRKRNYDTSDICHTGYCLTGLTSVCISFQCSDGRELGAVCKGETKYLLWANEGIMGIFSFPWVQFSGTVSLGFHFRAEAHLIHTQVQARIPIVAYSKDVHGSYLHIATFSSHAQSLLLTHSCTQWDAAYALSFSQCLGGHSNYCGSWATERQPSVWLIGISGQSRTQHNLRTQHTTVSSLIQNIFGTITNLYFPS